MSWLRRPLTWGDEMRMKTFSRKHAGETCLLCGGVPAVVVLFAPEAPEKWGGAAKRVRYFRYCLCRECSATGDTAERAEKIILSDLADGEVTHGL